MRPSAVLHYKDGACMRAKCYLLWLLPGDRAQYSLQWKRVCMALLLGRWQ